MTSASLLCRFISEHPDWRELLGKMDIVIKESPPYAIFNYGIGADFFSPLVCEARGIIINVENCTVVCWPFRKFGNWDEGYADSIDWSTAEVQEKIDGSIVKLWYDPIAKKWIWSTNGVIDAGEAPIWQSDSDITISFLDIIGSAVNFNRIMTCIKDGTLDRECTYIFELVSPETQVVLKYSTAFLFLTGIRNNVTGQEYSTKGYAEKITAVPRRYKLASFNDCMDAARKLNPQGGDVSHEGFVVVDKDFHRIKIKTPEYIALHHAINNGMPSKKNIVTLLREGSSLIDQMCRQYPSVSRYIRFYQWQIDELKFGAKQVCRKVDMLTASPDSDRKSIALAIIDSNYYPIGFMHLDSGKSADEILEEMSIDKYIRYLRDYSFMSNVV